MLLCKCVPILWTYDQVWALLAFFSLPINKWTAGATPISPPNFSLFNSSVMLLRTNLLKSITNSHGWQQRPLIKIRINLLLTFPTNAQSWHCREKANASCCWLQTPRILHRLTHLPRHALLSISLILICWDIHCRISHLYFSTVFLWSFTTCPILQDIHWWYYRSGSVANARSFHNRVPPPPWRRELIYRAGLFLPSLPPPPSQMNCQILCAKPGK